MYKEIEGDLIVLAKEGKFNVITHGCNCFCTMGSGIAPQMAKAFGCNNFAMEDKKYRGEINKLGQIDYEEIEIHHASGHHSLINVVNSYTQYNYDAKTKPFDYEAFTLCMRKINRLFKSQIIGLPQIGAGLAGGDWKIIKSIIQNELVDCNIIVVIYNPTK